MANRGELRLAYNNRRSNWFSKDPEEVPTVRSFKEVDCRMFIAQPIVFLNNPPIRR